MSKRIVRLFFLVWAIPLWYLRKHVPVGVGAYLVKDSREIKERLITGFMSSRQSFLGITLPHRHVWIEEEVVTDDLWAPGQVRYTHIHYLGRYSLASLGHLIVDLSALEDRCGHMQLSLVSEVGSARSDTVRWWTRVYIV